MHNLKSLIAVAVSALLTAPPFAFGSSHREAPITSLDRSAGITDFYAFVSYDDASKVTFIMNVDPSPEPANGPNYFPFDPNVVYSIKVDNNLDADADITFEFRFKTEIRRLGTPGPVAGSPLVAPAITALDGAGAAGFSLRQTYKVTMAQGSDDTATRTDLTPGSQRLIAVPSNAGPPTMPDYTALAKQGIYGLGSGMRVFAGTVDDPLFIDLGGTGLRTPADSAPGFKVNTIAIEVPASMIAMKGSPVIEAWAVTYRTKTTVRSAMGSRDSGGLVQIQRMGNPLFNEPIVPTGSKGLRSQSDANAGPAVRHGVKDQARPVADVLRLDTSVPPTPAASRSRLGGLAGDAAGFPNGRRLSDRVADIAQGVMGGADGGVAYQETFPYVAFAQSGRNRPAK